MKKSLWAGKNGPLLIAEIGGNHEGNFTYAKKLVKLAIDSGVDVVKLQLYSGDMLVSPIESKKRFKHFRKFELTKKQHIYLAKLCRSSGVKYLASVWDLKMLDWIDRYLNFYKIGSGDLTALPIIKEFAKRGKPIILSTGLSNLSEIKNTIKFIQKENRVYKSKNKLAILQCTSSYPTIDEEISIVNETTVGKESSVQKVFSKESIISFQNLTLRVPISDNVVNSPLDKAFSCVLRTLVTFIITTGGSLAPGTIG